MSPVSLEGHEPYLLKSISRMLARVDRAAASGEPLNMVVHLANMTLDSVGFAAFGVDLHCQDLTPEREADLQRALSRSASMLRSGSLQRSLSRALTLNGSSMRRMASAMTPRSPIFSPRSPAPWESPRRRTRMGFNPPDAPVKPAGTEPLVPPKSPTTPPASQPPESPVKPPASQPAKLPFKAPAFQLPESPVNPPTSQPLVLEPEVQQDWMDMLGSREFGHGLVVALKNMIRLGECHTSVACEFVAYGIPRSLCSTHVHVSTCVDAWVSALALSILTMLAVAVCVVQRSPNKAVHSRPWCATHTHTHTHTRTHAPAHTRTHIAH